jgi:hypothetical protein
MTAEKKGAPCGHVSPRLDDCGPTNWCYMGVVKDRRYGDRWWGAAVVDAALAALPPAPAEPRINWLARARTRLECRHRGEASGDPVPCPTCGKRERTVQPYACAVHGRCSLTVLLPVQHGKIQVCSLCPDLSPKGT